MSPSSLPVKVTVPVDGSSPTTSGRSSRRVSIVAYDGGSAAGTEVELTTGPSAMPLGALSAVAVAVRSTSVTPLEAGTVTSAVKVPSSLLDRSTGSPSIVSVTS